MNVRGIDKSPSPYKYYLPSTLSKVKKTFGIPYEHYTKVVVPGDKKPDAGNPGPGTYMSNIRNPSKRLNSKCGSIGLP